MNLDLNTINEDAVYGDWAHNDTTTSQAAYNDTFHKTSGCSKIPPPQSTAFLNDLSSTYIALICTCGVLSIITLVLFLESIMFILRHYKTPKHTRFKSVQLLGIYPVMTLCAILSIMVPRSVIICRFVSAIYISVSMFKFVGLVVNYTGGGLRLIKRLHSHNVRIPLRSPPFCCCCVCLPAVTPTIKRIKILKMLVFQAAFFQPIIAFISLVLWVDRIHYRLGKIESDNAAMYLAPLNLISTLIAIYGIILFVRTVKEPLSYLDIGPKYIALQLVLVLQNLQYIIFNILAMNDIPQCSGNLSSPVRAQIHHNMLIVVEMLLLMLLARGFYHRPHSQMLAMSEILIDESPSSDKKLNESVYDTPKTNGVATEQPFEHIVKNSKKLGELLDHCPESNV